MGLTEKLERFGGDIPQLHVLAEAGAPPRQIKAVSGAAYTLVEEDGGKTIEHTHGSAATLTLPPNADVALAVGTVVKVVQMGAGDITITAGLGVTLRNPGATAETRAQYAAVEVYKSDTNVWVMSGDVAAS